jgi:hexokinase
MFSGGYFGGLCLTVLKAAARERVFSRQAADRLINLSELSTAETNDFVGHLVSGDNQLSVCFSDQLDAKKCSLIIDALIDRAAKLVAGNLSAVVLKTGKGMSADHPVLITIDGTTFFKLHRLKERFEEYFFGYLSAEKRRYVEFTEVPHASLIGAALAALLER